MPDGPTRCPRCGYDLSGSAASFCTECGIDPASWKSPARTWWSCVCLGTPAAIADVWLPLGLALASEMPSVNMAILGSSLAALNAGMALWLLLGAWRSTSLGLACVIDCLIWMQFLFLLYVLSNALP